MLRRCALCGSENIYESTLGKPTDNGQRENRASPIQMSNAFQSESIEIIYPGGESLNSKYSEIGTSIEKIVGDISILDAYDSHFGSDAFDNCSPSNSILTQSLEATDFTVLNAEGMSKNALLNSNAYSPTSGECMNSHMRRREDGSNCALTISCTDSDVEILTSEEVTDTSTFVDSQSSTNGTINSIKLVGETIKDAIDGDNDKAAPECDKHTNDDGYIINSMGTYEQLSRVQLINVIVQQARRIRSMELSLNRILQAQHTLFEHVDAMRSQVSIDRSIDSQLTDEIGGLTLIQSNNDETRNYFNGSQNSCSNDSNE